MHNFQKSSRHDRQKTCEHESMIHRAPLIDVRHTSHSYEFCENRVACVDLSNFSSSGNNDPGVGWLMLSNALGRYPDSKIDDVLDGSLSLDHRNQIQLLQEVTAAYPLYPGIQHAFTLFPLICQTGA